MVDLPRISEDFTADASGYIAALQAMISQTNDLIGKVSELKSLVDSLDGKTIAINVGGDANAQLDLISSKIDALDGKTVAINIVGHENLPPVVQQVIQHVTPDDTNALKTQFESVITTDTVVENTAQAVSALDALGAAIDDVRSKMTAENLDAAASAAILSKLAYSVQAVSNANKDAAATATVAAAAEEKLNAAKFDSSAATLAAVDATLALANTEKLLADASAVIGGDVSKMMDIFGVAPAKVGPFNDLFMTTNNLWHSGGGWLGFLTGKMELFGGALTNMGLPAFIAQASGLHILVDTGIEIGATLIPALIALGTFGAAAAGTVGDLYKHENDVFQVTRALQQNMYPFTNQLQAMQNAVKPEVYVLFGEALQIMNNNTGAFTSLAIAAGRVLDDLGARITNALKSNDFQSFLAKATQDLAGWGTLIGNIFGTIGAILHNLPGYAEMFLSLADKVSAIMESFAQGAGKVIEWGLAVHGALLWGGLLVTGLVALQGPITAAIDWLHGLAINLIAYGVEIATAEGATATFEAILAPLAAINPFVWVAIAVGALVALGVAFANTANDAKGFNSAMESAVQGSTLNMLSTTFNTAINETTQKLAQANQQVASSEAQVADAAKKGKAAYLDQVQAVQQNVQQANQLAGGLKTLQQQYQGVQQFIQSLVPIVGSASGALNAMNAIGITSKDLIGASKTQLAEYTTEIVAYTDALRAASDGTGRFAAAENALSFANEDANNKLGQIDSTMKNVTQDQTQLIGVLTGSSSAFDTFELGQQTMTQNFGQVSSATANATHHLGDLTLSSSLAGAAMGGTSAASLTLNQSFYQQVNNAQSLISALEMQGVKTQDLTTIVATAAQQMLVFAGNNTEARAVVASLINDALGPTTVSLQSMNSWVEQNSTSQAGLTTLIGKTTIAATQLAQTLSGDLNAMMAQSIADAYGGQKAFDAFAQGVLNGTTQSTQFTNAAASVITTLIKQYGSDLPAAQSAFMKYAVNGLGMTTDAANALWIQTVSRLDPSLVDMATKVTAIIQPSFINWAEKGLKYSQTQATNLWSELASKLGPELNNSLANAVLSSQGNFEHWATHSLGLSISQADALYQEITQKLTPAINNIPKNPIVTLTESASGVFTLGGMTLTGPQALALAQMQDLALHHAAGGVIPGYQPGHDTVPAMLSPGEGILTPQAVKMIGAGTVHGLNSAAKHFASGGIVGLSTETTTFDQAFHNVFTKDMQNILAGELSGISAGVAAAQKAANAFSSTPGPGINSIGGFFALNQDFLSAMALTGTPGSWLNDLETIARYESGFNPNAINLSDSNAAAGDPSRGLMQTIMSTFIGYHQAGTSNNIYDPVANIAAAINYIKARYGTVFNVPGIVSLSRGGGYVGYDSGGYLMPGLTLAYNGTGRPETVSPPGAGTEGQLHAVVNIDGKSVFDALTPYAYQKASRNSGNVNAGSYWTPGRGA